jgi:hypothetical protein
MLIAEIAQYLNTQGIGVYEDGGPGGDIFLESCPSSPDEVVYITSSGGAAPDRGFPVDRPTVQMIVRGGLSPVAAESRAQAIYDALHGFHHDQFVDDGTWIVDCFALNTPTHIGVDDLGRHEYSLNFQLEIINNSTHRAW